MKSHSLHREKRNAYKVLVGKPKGKKSLGRPKHRWENIKKRTVNVRLGGSGLDSHSQWHALMNTVLVLTIQVPKSVGTLSR
jgi:hypothetical protein